MKKTDWRKKSVPSPSVKDVATWSIKMTMLQSIAHTEKEATKKGASGVFDVALGNFHVNVVVDCSQRCSQQVVVAEHQQPKHQ